MDTLHDRVQACYLIAKLRDAELIDLDEARGAIALLLPELLPLPESKNPTGEQR